MKGKRMSLFKKEKSGSTPYYIFFDVDGVLNRKSDWKQSFTLNPECIEVFGVLHKRLQKAGYRPETAQPCKRTAQRNFEGGIFMNRSVYIQMNEQLHPNPKTVDKLIEQTRPKKSIFGKFSRLPKPVKTALLTVLIVALSSTTLTVASDNSAEFRDMLYSISPRVGAFLPALQKPCRASGLYLFCKRPLGTQHAIISFSLCTVTPLLLMSS